MEQRRLRLGDILDDYCPRERRITNHAVVAMIEEDVKQTRCTTCDAEHVYKGGKPPRRRKKGTTEALYEEVLAGMPDAEGAAVIPAGHLATDSSVAAMVPETVAREEPAVPVPALNTEAKTAVTNGASAKEPEQVHVEPGEPVQVEEGPVHRPLIRAQLPRIDGHKEERRLPEFTIRQNNGRGANAPFRGGDARMKPRGGQGGTGQGANNGNRPHGGPRFAGPRPAGGGPGRGAPGRGGPAAGFRGGGPPRQGGGRKRSR